MKRSPASVVGVGLVALVVALGMAHAEIAANPYPYGGGRFGWGLAFAGTLIVSSYAFGLPDVPRVPRQIVPAVLGAVVTGTLVIAVAQAVLGAQLLPRFVLFGGAVGATAWLGVVTSLEATRRRRAEDRDRVLVVADRESTAQLLAELAAVPWRTTIAATVEPEAVRPSATDTAPMLTLADESDATIVVLDRGAQVDQTIVDQAALLHERGVRVRTLSLFYEQFLFRLPVGELERVSLMFDIGEVHRERYARRKRLLDIALALLGLPVLAVATAFVAVVNPLANRGSVLFRQERVGKNGNPFRILKFRTMTGASAGAGTWTSDDDDRITAFGAILRRTHVDELPQLLNVLRGELSIVGPRPEQPHYVDELSRKLPFYDLRHLVQPGLTGWAQVNQGYAASEADALEKLQFEFWYLRHQSMSMDLRVMARTVRSVLQGRGR
ncbi:MAG: sugar transferase [Actinomycetota bacterium]